MDKPGTWPDRMPLGPFYRGRLNPMMIGIINSFTRLTPEQIKELEHPDFLLMKDEDPPNAQAYAHLTNAQLK